MSDRDSISSLGSADVAEIKRVLERRGNHLKSNNGVNEEASCTSWLVPLMVIIGVTLLIYLIYNYGSCGRRSSSDSDSNTGNGVILVSNMTNNTAQSSQPMPSNPQVIELDGDQVNSMNQEKAIIVAFFAQGCHWCQKLKPSYAEVAKLVNRPIYSLHAHVKNGMETCKQYGVQGFPTIKLLHKGRVLAEYNGDRSAADIAKWVKSLQ